MKQKWLEQYPVCQGCGRDWSQVKHSAKGLCRGCVRKKQHTEGLDKKRQRWSKDHDYCQDVNCPSTTNGVTSQPHNADGLCQSCYSKAQRYINYEHTLVVEAARRNLPENKEEQQERHHDWYLENKDHLYAYNAQYRKEHPDLNKEACTTYREANREVCRASYKKWYEENQEKSTGYGRKWREEHPEESRQHNRDRRAKLAGLEGSFTVEEWMDLCEAHEFKCYHCGRDDVLLTPDHLVPVDSVDIIPTNDIDNIGPLCGPCNSSKRDRPLFDFDRDYLEKRAMKLAAEGKEDHCVVKIWKEVRP